MSANVETMAYVGATPWHGLGTAMEESDWYNLDSVIAKSGLDWEAEKVQLKTVDALTEFPDGQIVDHYAVRRKTDNRILGTVGPRYTILQNRKAFEWFEPFSKAKEAAFHTAGSLDEGSRIWILAKINRDPMVIVPGDEVEKYLLLSHSHDGTLAVRVGFTPIRVVCANTLAMAHGDKASKLIRIKHSAKVETNLDNIRDTINLANKEFEATAEQYRKLANKDINKADLEKYVKTVMGLEDEKEISTRSKNIMDEIVGLFETGKGNDMPGVKGTYWAAYNGITQYYTWDAGRNESNRLNSLWFGPNANKNKEALETALQMAA